MTLSINQKIDLSLVENLCRRFGQPSPWGHGQLGNSLPHVAVLGEPLKAKRLPDLILKSYQGKPKVRLKQLKAKLERLDVSNAAESVVLSGTQLYELLKQLELNPEIMLKSVQVSSAAV